MSMTSPWRENRAALLTKIRAATRGSRIFLRSKFVVTDQPGVALELRGQPRAREKTHAIA